MGKKTIKRKRKTSRKSSSASKKTLDVSHEKLQQILSQTRQFLNEDDAEILEGAIDTLTVVTNELEMKGASVARLRRLLFGATTEKMSNIFPKTDDSSVEKPADENALNNSEKNTDSKDATDSKKKNKGHGRNGADKYTGAQKQEHEHESLTHKGNCPEDGCDGKLYRQKEPKRLVRVTGVAPLSATVHELERLRCNLCGKIFTAESPNGVGEETYDNNARAMIALLKYGSGTPFNRLEQLQTNLGIPLPTSTQWDEVCKLAHAAAPVYTELIAQAANGKVLHNDDTTAKILKLEPSGKIGKNGKERIGIYTSGILSAGEREIALFFTGHNHAGENLETVLAHRNQELAAPIQMCDGMSANTVGDFETVLANCNAHARRKFVEVAGDYPKETEHILNGFKAVYKNDKDTIGMNDNERLAYHVEHSKPLFDDLKTWFHTQLETTKTIEPNSSLGVAIGYMQKRWEELTLFLRVPGAPLDNNACERAIKKAILHRKNAMFFKTENGAHVADVFMSIIHTCELSNINPFKYLVAIADRFEAAAGSPAAWLPWNFQFNIEK